MSLPLEHDYIGLSEPSPVERSYCSSAHSSSEDLKASALNLKQTELRLGLPGSQSPERNQGLLSLSINKKPNGYPLNSSKTNLVSGAKRGFSDAINDGFSEKWGFGSEDVKGAALLFSPKGESNAKTLQQVCVSGQVKKEVAASVVAQSTKAGQEKQKKPQVSENVTPPAAKAQVVGWPPIRSFRKNTMASNLTKNNDDAEVKQGSGGCLYVKVSMDGAPYLRKVDLNMYKNYMELSMALEKMFSCFIIGKCNSKGLPEKDSLRESRLMDLLPGSEYVLTFEDKDVDWMLVGDVPWGMFTETCRKLRIMKGSEAIGLAPRAVEKCKN